MRRHNTIIEECGMELFAINEPGDRLVFVLFFFASVIIRPGRRGSWRGVPPN